MGKPELRVIKGTKNERPLGYDDRLEPPGRGLWSGVLILAMWSAIALGLVAVNEVMKLFEK